MLISLEKHGAAANGVVKEQIDKVDYLDLRVNHQPNLLEHAVVGGEHLLQEAQGARRLLLVLLLVRAAD